MTRSLSDTEKKILLSLARLSIKDRFEKNPDEVDQIKRQLPDEFIEQNRGVFVSLHKHGHLRGCIGNIEPVKTVFNGIWDNAKHAAFKDSRFPPLSREELKDTQIEISILTPPNRLTYSDHFELISKLKPEIHGVIIEKGHCKATFLPQVWHQLESPEKFLEHLCIKAGLPQDEWKTGSLKVYTYEVTFFEE